VDPVKAGEGQRQFASRRRFAYIADRQPATAVKWAVGTIVYALVIAFLVAIVLLVRGVALSEPPPAPAA